MKWRRHGADGCVSLRATPLFCKEFSLVPLLYDKEAVSSHGLMAVWTEGFHADRGAQSVFAAEVITRAVTAPRIPRLGHMIVVLKTHSLLLTLTPDPLLWIIFTVTPTPPRSCNHQSTII